MCLSQSYVAVAKYPSLSTLLRKEAHWTHTSENLRASAWSGERFGEGGITVEGVYVEQSRGGGAKLFYNN